MGRALLSVRVANQVGDLQPNISVLVLETDGTTPLAQTMFAAPTGPATRANPLTTDDYGFAVAYVELSQRVIVEVGGVQTVVDITDDPGDIAALTSTVVAGDVLIGTGAGSVGRLGIGAAFQELATNAAGAAPEWFNGIRAVLTAIGDIPYASAPNTIARAPKGSAWQSLVMNAAANAPQWSSCVLALAAAAGDTFYATGANALARLAKGTAFQVLAMNAGATAPAWANCAVTVVQTAGDLVYATGANALARLAAGATGTVLHGGATPSWSAVVTADLAADAATQTSSAVGTTSGPTQATGSPVDLPEMTRTITSTGGPILCVFSGTFRNSVAGASILLDLVVDGSLQIRREFAAPLAAENYVIAFSKIVAAAAGSRTIKIQWLVDAGTATADSTNRSLDVLEHKR